MDDLGFDNFPWIAPWVPVSERGREAYEHELWLELAPGHPLYGVHVTAVARTCNSDDVLFRLHDHPAALAVAHLTYSGQPEPEPKWPHIVLYRDLDHWVSRGLLPDAARYEIRRDRAA